jgi:predicted MFS family arabinose efflux permease
MYSFIQTVTLLGAALAAKGAGWLMDGNDTFWVRVLYPSAALCGFLGFWLHGRIRWRRRRRAQARRAKTSWRDVWRILKEDRAFRIYEIGFMTYGVAFLMGWALLSLYAEGPLNLSYDQFTDAVGYAFPLALVCGAWFWGRFTDRLGVIRLSAVAITTLAGFYLFMLLAVSGHRTFVTGFALFGFAMAAIDVGWSLGPLHFAPEGEAHMYTAVHFALVGVRSLFAPFLGLWMMRSLGYHVTFASCATLLLAASLVLWRLSRRSP